MNWKFLAISLTMVLSWASYSSARELKPVNATVTVALGEEFSMDGKGEKCKTTADDVVSVVSADECRFRSQRTGEAKIGNSSAFVAVKVVRAKDLPRVTIAELFKNPEKYDGLFALSGKAVGWGTPSKGKKTQGARRTKSDWVLEDDSGAVYITGSMPPDYPEVVVAAILYSNGKQWGVISVVVNPVDVVLKPDQVNELFVGQVGIIEVFPSRSEVAEEKIIGDAVESYENDLNTFSVKAVRPGEAEVEIYLKWWNHFVPEFSPESENGAEEKPSAIYKIKVK